MEFHASCAARDAAGVLLMGPSGAGKSDLLLRLLDQGFDLVADDRVWVEAGIARPVSGGEGLLEVRGLGILRLPYVARVRVRLAVQLSRQLGPRLPEPTPLARLGVPVIALDPSVASAAARVAIALDCLVGRVGQVAGFVVA